MRRRGAAERAASVPLRPVLPAQRRCAVMPPRIAPPPQTALSQCSQPSSKPAAPNRPAPNSCCQPNLLLQVEFLKDGIQVLLIHCGLALGLSRPLLLAVLPAALAAALLLPAAAPLLGAAAGAGGGAGRRRRLGAAGLLIAAACLLSAIFLVVLCTAGAEGAVSRASEACRRSQALWARTEEVSRVKGLNGVLAGACSSSSLLDSSSSLGSGCATPSCCASSFLCALPAILTNCKLRSMHYCTELPHPPPPPLRRRRCAGSCPDQLFLTAAVLPRLSTLCVAFGCGMTVCERGIARIGQ